MKKIGIIIIVLGIAMLIFTSINFKTEKEVVDLGPLKVNKTENHHLGWPQYVGGIIVVAGIVVLGLGFKGQKK